MLKLNKKEILRYLGYKRHQPLTDEVSAIVDEMMTKVQEVSKPRYTYKIFDCVPDFDAQTIRVGNTDLVLTGKAIFKHLQKAQKIALLATTLGIEVEYQIRRYEITDITRSMVLDSCCVEYIEEICDMAECDIEEHVKDQKLTLNRRFSPGYGDLPLDVQPQFIQTMDATKQLGITLTATKLMVPRKSVTAIIGLFENPEEALPKRHAQPCRDCHNEDCNFRIGGK
jgi:hypothetical protein